MAKIFTVDTWKSQITDWWQQTARDLPGTMKRLEVRTAYGLLTASAFMPLLAAYTDDPGKAATALVGIVGGVGTNLLSNLLQSKYDKTNAPRQAEQEVAERPDLRPEYQQLLNSLNVVAVAQTALGNQWVEFEKQLRNELSQLGGSLYIESGGGAIVLGSVSTSGGKFVGSDDYSMTVFGPVTIVQAPPGPKPLPLPQALQRYLDNLIDTHQHLRLQGIRSGGQPLSVALEKVYVSLTAIEKRAPRADTAKYREGEAEFVHVGLQPLTIGAALNRYRRLVIIGDPGCGKTTLLNYLALTYARGMRDREHTVHERLSLREPVRLPILLPLRDLGRHLKTRHSDPSCDGPAMLLNYLQEFYAAQSIQLPEDFFLSRLERKKAVVLLDGMDEVADSSYVSV